MARLRSSKKAAEGDSGSDIEQSQGRGRKRVITGSDEESRHEQSDSEDCGSGESDQEEEVLRRQALESDVQDADESVELGHRLCLEDERPRATSRQKQGDRKRRRQSSSVEGSGPAVKRRRRSEERRYRDRPASSQKGRQDSQTRMYRGQSTSSRERRRESEARRYRGRSTSSRKESRRVGTRGPMHKLSFKFRDNLQDNSMGRARKERGGQMTRRVPTSERLPGASSRNHVSVESEDSSAGMEDRRGARKKLKAKRAKRESEAAPAGKRAKKAKWNRVKRRNPTPPRTRSSSSSSDAVEKSSSSETDTEQEETQSKGKSTDAEGKSGTEKGTKAVEEFFKDKRDKAKIQGEANRKTHSYLKNSTKILKRVSSMLPEGEAKGMLDGLRRLNEEQQDVIEVRDSYGERGVDMLQAQKQMAGSGSGVAQVAAIGLMVGQGQHQQPAPYRERAYDRPFRAQEMQQGRRSDYAQGAGQRNRGQQGRSGPKPTDICNACGRKGHWARNCERRGGGGRRSI